MTYAVGRATTDSTLHAYCLFSMVSCSDQQGYTRETVTTVHGKLTSLMRCYCYVKYTLIIHEPNFHRIKEISYEHPIFIVSTRGESFDFGLGESRGRNRNNIPFPSSCLLPLQSESKREVFVMVITYT